MKLQFQNMIKTIQEEEASNNGIIDDYTQFPYKKLYMVYIYNSHLAEEIQESFFNSSPIKQQAVFSDMKELRDKYEYLNKVHKELICVIPEDVKKDFEKLSQKITKKISSIFPNNKKSLCQKG